MHSTRLRVAPVRSVKTYLAVGYAPHMPHPLKPYVAGVAAPMVPSRWDAR